MAKKQNRFMEIYFVVVSILIIMSLYLYYDKEEYVCEEIISSELRLKTQSELDIDDCNSNPREDEKCKCEEYLKYPTETKLRLVYNKYRLEEKNISFADLNYSFYWYIGDFLIDCERPVEDCFVYEIMQSKTDCLKSRPKTECEKGTDGWVEELKNETPN